MKTITIKSFFRRFIRKQPINTHEDLEEPINTHKGQEGFCNELSVPIVQLPHRVHDNGLLDYDSSPDPCGRCRWTGAARQFLAWGQYMRFDRNQDSVLVSIRYMRFDCVSCYVLGLALIQVARLHLHKRSIVRGRVLRMHDFKIQADYRAGCYITITTRADDDKLDGTCPIDPYWHIFSPIGGPQSAIDTYNIPRRRWTGPNVSCEESVQFAKNCIEECRQSHEICRSEANSLFLPTRMICVDAYQLEPNCFDVRLDENTSIPPGSRYVALSYCWGNYRPACMTTYSNLGSQMERIRWEAMPATFQDAVNFTRSLGVRYLWIDSICIIQQDREKLSGEAEADWVKEAAKMFEVYKNSYATLAALYGHDSRAGLRKDSNKSRSTALAFLKLEESYLPLFIRQAHFLDGSIVSQHHETRHYEPGSCPLLTRAWTFQERIVSPRVLYFTDTEIIFNCFHDAKCECGATTEADFKYVRKPSPAGYKITERGRRVVELTQQAEWEHRLLKGSTVAQAWREEIVSAYSSLDLTESRDRLPALGAIAQQFQAVRHNEKYLAGLWTATLHEDLLWACSEISGPSHPRSALRRPHSLPTWSWASLPVSVTFKCGGGTGVAVIVQASCVYAAENQFGILQSSILILRSRALRVLVNWKVRSFAPEPICELFYFQKGAWKAISLKRRAYGGITTHIHIDHDGTGYPILPEKEELYVFEITKSDFGSWGYLLLREEDQEKSIYTRAGIISDFYSKLSVLPEETESKTVRNCFNAVFSEHSVVKQCEIR